MIGFRFQQSPYLRQEEKEKGKRQKSEVGNYVYLYIYVPSASAWIKRIKCWAFCPLIFAFCFYSQHPAPNYCFVKTSLTSSTPIGISMVR
jgi:hypothetical protein